ncbi:ABC transporter permease [Pseudalkalibacillus caeni]|uniref:Transport permease protein n=1 Tax=Exobacillus caeni TaxID=2574798 RepID=A0A5R9F8U7_9BACL|nr:ABC transporter permease [Pseudalkalibacillus caeni]TLS38680.1 ABC transporter permease [Pseudalkalibacillus caeni]
MRYMFQVLKEQFTNLHLIFRLALYEVKSRYQLHYLGVFWQFLNPAIQVGVYWFVFGLGIRGGEPIGDVPFFVWLVAGLIPWLFISPSIIQGSNSVYTKVNLVSKMKFPISVLPTITIVSNAFNFLIMLLVIGLILFIYHINPGMYLLQLPYYLLGLFAFLFSFTLLCSSISTIIRDFQMVLQSVMRMMMYLTPILWNMDKLPETLVTVLKLNPVFYLIVGFRSTFLGTAWFFENMVYTGYFWSATLFILLIGSVIHLKFRDKFVDYL